MLTKSPLLTMSFRFPSMVDFVLLNSEKVTYGITIEKVNNVILKTLLIIEVKNGRKLVSIEASGYILIECRIRVSVQLKENLAPYLMVLHCCVHCTNLAIQIFYIMQCMQYLLQSFHSYFARSKKSLELLSTLLDTKGN